MKTARYFSTLSLITLAFLFPQMALSSNEGSPSLLAQEDFFDPFSDFSEFDETGSEEADL